jgi:crotonobetainyl-CoA:carnitine CoA-transferase CaiB-like acyl-CoA transferase
VIENLGVKRAAALGLGASSAAASRGDLLALSSSGFGMDGPHSAYRAYAYNLQASCGLGYLTRTEDGEPAEIDIAWADLISAYALATIIAAWVVGPSGNRGVGIDFAMSDLIVSHFNEFIAAASLDPDSDRSVDRANELAPYAPHGVYPTSDGWIALAIENDEQFDRLVKVLEDERLAAGSFDSSAGRFEQRRALDAHLADALRTRSAREVASELRAAGIVAEEVMTAAQLIVNLQLASRGFLTEVEHPQRGRRRRDGVPWRPFGAPPLPLGAPPLLEALDGRPGDR